MDADPDAPRRRLRHRVPLSLRKHWKSLVGGVVALLVVVVILGDTRIRPYITGDATVIASPVTQNVTGTVELFDSSVAHELHLKIDDAEYARMIDEYERNGDKEWVTADLTIDGEFINDVAVRLKGNSTLRGLGGEGAGPGAREGGGPGGGRQVGERPAAPEGIQPPGGMGAMPGMDTGISADDPASLPLLISFDKNYEGRAYQGMTELSVRPGTPVLNEAVALELTEATGQATQQYAYSQYSLNDGASTTRLVLEHPDDGYVSSTFDGPGYLYKADASSQFAYVGEDQSDYSEQFSQVNAQDGGTMQPIIDLLRWEDSASDEQFAAELDQWVDVDSLAAYVATQNLLANGDDMSGPGRNYYLWYDLEAEKFTVVSWDLNMAMSGNTSAGPHDSTSMGGFGGGGAGGGGAGGGGARMGEMPGGGTMAPPGGARAGVPGAARVGGGARGGSPAGAPGKAPADAPANAPVAPPAGGFPDAPADGGDERRGGMAMDHPLKTRFLESDAFTELYEQTYWDLYDQVYGSGLATQTLDAVAASFPLSDAVDQARLDEEAGSLRTWIEQRTTALADQRPQ